MDRKVYEFISKQASDPILERITCKWTGEIFPVFQGDKTLLQKIAPVIGGQKYDLPLPTLSREARRRRRLMRRNDRKLYRATCKMTNKPLVTFYHPDLEKNIVEHTERYKSVDNTSCALDFDPSKTFNEQISLLLAKTMKKNILTVGLMENSDYTHNVGDMKNCYMVFDTGMAEDSLYSVRTARVKNVVDVLETHRSENIYDSITIHRSRNIFYSQDSADCSFGAFLYNCLGCHNCICCSNLVNKNYYAFNKQVTKEEYQQLWQEIFDGKRSTLAKFTKEYENMRNHALKKHLNITNCENSIGHNIQNGKNLFLCEEGTGGENIRYAERMNIAAKLEDCMDISSRGSNMNNCYELNCCGSDDNTTASNCHFGSYLFRGVNHAQYSINIPSASDYLFGCSDIDNKKYHILNKKYTPAEYEKLVPRIIDQMTKTGEWGEFLDPQYSSFPYNDTIANDYYPVHRLAYPDGTTQIIHQDGTGTMYIHEPDKTISLATLDLGGTEKITTKRRTKELEVNVPEGLSIINGKDLPDDISDISDEITNKAIICVESGRPFRIIKQELDFYRTHGLPAPIKHPDIRHLDRLKQTAKFDLHLRKCDKCAIEMLSIYKQGNESEVYCEACYNHEIYG